MTTTVKRFVAGLLTVALMTVCVLSGVAFVAAADAASPIIQNGKLLGAVTHVLVNDPTTGYGIFIENMLDAAA